MPNSDSLDKNSPTATVLERLNQACAALNHVPAGKNANLESVVNLVLQSIEQILPGSKAHITLFSQKTNDSEAAALQDYPSSGFEMVRTWINEADQRTTKNGGRVISYEESGEAAFLPEHTVAAAWILTAAGQRLGALHLFLTTVHQFSPDDLLSLEVFIHQAATTILQAQQLSSFQHDLARMGDELRHMRRTGLLISSRLRLEETLEAILQMALEITDAKYGIFRLMDKDGKNLITRAIAGAELTQPRKEALPVDSHSVMGWVARTSQPVCIFDLHAEPWSQIYYPLDTDFQMRSELAVPLISSGGRVEGVLNLESPQPGAFSEQDSHMLQSLATQAVIAIQEVRLLDAIQESAQLLLLEPSQKVLERLANLACDLLNATASMIWTIDEDWLVLRSAGGQGQIARRVEIKDSLTGLSVLKRAPVISPDIQTDDRFFHHELARANNWTTALVVPLMASDAHEPIGAFGVYSTSEDPGRFTESEWDKKVLTCLAHYAVLAVQNDVHQEALRAAQEQRAVAETFAVIGDIAANLLHHLNNKVGTIPVRVQGIQDKCKNALANDHYLANNLAEIERSANEAMQAMRENLVHLRPIHMAEVQVISSVNEALKSASLPAGVNVEVADLKALPPVVAGQRSLALVFTNLLENAADAMHGEGLIRIHGSARNKWVDINVTDSGPGIPPELHSRIFELNYSGRGIARPGKLGFGLWWVKTVMARLGGSVTVESDGVHGSTFRIRLPIAEVKK